MSTQIFDGATSEKVYGEARVEHEGDYSIEDVPRDPSAYRVHRHFIVAYKERTEITGDLINHLFTEGDLYYANGKDRFMFCDEIQGVPFWLIVVMKPDESKHLALTAYSPDLHSEGRKWRA